MPGASTTSPRERTLQVVFAGAKCIPTINYITWLLHQPEWCAAEQIEEHGVPTWGKELAIGEQVFIPIGQQPWSSGEIHRDSGGCPVGPGDRYRTGVARDRGRDGALGCAAPPSEPYVRVSRIRLSGQRVPRRDCSSRSRASSSERYPSARKKAFGHLAWSPWLRPDPRPRLLRLRRMRRSRLLTW